MITGWHQKYHSENLYSMFVALNLQCVYFYFERQWQMVMILYVREGGRRTASSSDGGKIGAR